MPASLSPMTQVWPIGCQSGLSSDLREGTRPAGEITSATKNRVGRAVASRLRRTGL